MRLTATAKLILLILTLAVCAGAGAAPVLTLSELAEPVSPRVELLIVEDADASLDFPGARQALTDSGYYWDGVRYPQFGFSDSIYWARLDIRNFFSSDETWLVRIDTPGQDYVDFFYQNSDGVWQEIKSGVSRPFSSRSLPHVETNFVFPVFAGQSQSLYFRFSDAGVVRLPLTLMSTQQHQVQAAHSYFVDAFQFGALIMLALASMLVWFTSRKPSFFWCSLFLVFATLYAVGFNGYALQVWWPDYPLWDQHVQLMASGLAAACGLMFLSCILNLRGHLRPLRIALRLAALVIALSLLLVFVLPVTAIHIAGLLRSMGAIAVASVVSGLAYKEQDRATRFVIIASLVFMLGVAFQVLVVTTNALPEILNFHGTTALTVIAVALLMTGVADYIRGAMRKQRHTRDELFDVRNRAEVALQQAERIKDQFIDNVSHELLTPIHGILNLSDSMLDHSREESADRQLESLMLIKDNASRLARLTDNILDMAMLESQTYRLSAAEVDVKALCTRVVESCRVQAGEKAIHVLEDYPEGRFMVHAEAAKLEHVLVNLITNAISVTAYGYVMVSLAMEEQGDKVTISVKDTGPGVPPGEQENIFRRFYKLENTQSFTGPGLGLAVSQRIMEIHGSRIQLESEPGKGSVFYFTLPLLHVAAKRSASAAPLQPPSFPAESESATAAQSHISAPSEQIQPEDPQLAYRRQYVKIMQDCLHAWRSVTGGNEIDLARESGIWAVTSDGQRVRARALQRYLSLEKLPAHPRKRQVLQTAHFVLDRLRKAGDQDATAYLESSLREFQAAENNTVPTA